MRGWWEWIASFFAGSSGPAVDPVGSPAIGRRRVRKAIDPGDLPGPTASDALIWWLEKQGPDELHRVALGWNWDCSTRPLRYIVDRSDCDKGTALTIFYSAEPERFASHNISGPYHQVEYQPYFQEELKPSDDDFMFEDGLWLMRRISENWAAGRYRTFDFYPGENAVHWLTRHPLHARPRPDNMPWPVPADLCAAVPRGEVLAMNAFEEGYPSELVEALERRPDILP